MTQLNLELDQKFLYLFDFGDEWRFTVRVHPINPDAPDGEYPRIVEPTQAYGVLGLVNPIEEIIGPNLPIYVNAVLLPFEGKIIYDGLISPYNVSFGGGIRRDLNDSYRKAQEYGGSSPA